MPAERIKRLPPYLFGRLNALKLAKRQAGADIIDLGMGNPEKNDDTVSVSKVSRRNVSIIAIIPNTKGKMARVIKIDIGSRCIGFVANS